MIQHASQQSSNPKWLASKPKWLTAVTTTVAVMWLAALIDWRWFSRSKQWGIWQQTGFPETTLIWVSFGLACLTIIPWAFLARKSGEHWRLAAVLTLGFVPVWQLLVLAAGDLGFAWLRSLIASGGTWGLFCVGLGWVIWILERSGQRRERARRMAEFAATVSSSSKLTLEVASEKPDAKSITKEGGVADLDVALTLTSARRARNVGSSADRLIWNPLDLDAWYYSVSLTQWFSPRFWLRLIRNPRHAVAAGGGARQKKLNQSLAGFLSYTFVFMLAFLVLTQIGGCAIDSYEMPAGGGEQKQIAQQVRIQKIIRKRFVVNPFSAIRFVVPPIEEVRLNLSEVTKHSYSVGYGQGTGAGFAGGTSTGKVRFIRLEYAGGDWDQDMGVGADLNMLIQYGIRTKHKVDGKTESRRVLELRNFPIGKSPPFVFLTGQRSISLSETEEKVLRDYLFDKHGMIFCDNGGSMHFHNQFVSMMARIAPNIRPVAVPLDDVIHRVPYPIPFLPYVAPHGGKEALGWKHEGRWIAYYHPGDIGDAWSDDHAGVKPEIWEFCYQLGTNVIFYAHSEYAKWLEARKKQ